MSSNMTLLPVAENDTDVVKAGILENSNTANEAEKPYQVPISQEAINFMLISKIFFNN